MITKEQLSASMTRECDICKHLFTKLTPESYEYRPAPDQRSTLELLQYLTACGIGGIRSLAERDWKIFGECVTGSKSMPAHEFPAAMDRQTRDIESFFAATSEETLATQQAPVMPSGMLPLGAAILGGPFKWLTAYKLQLFLYAKASGARDIGTANAWAGIDWKK